MLWTRSTPERRNAASSTSSLPLREPVWDAAAFAAAAVRPALITITGLRSDTSRAAERNDRASPIDSMYSTMLVVCGSSARWSIRSPHPTSSIDPADTNALNPTFSRRLQSRIAVKSAPLWDERDVPGPGHAGSEGGVEPGPGAHHPEAVRADHPHRTALEVGAHLLLEGDPGRARLPKPG